MSFKNKYFDSMIQISYCDPFIFRFAQWSMCLKALIR